MNINDVDTIAASMIVDTTTVATTTVLTTNHAEVDVSIFNDMVSVYLPDRLSLCYRPFRALSNFNIRLFHADYY